MPKKIIKTIIEPAVNQATPENLIQRKSEDTFLGVNAETLELMTHTVSDDEKKIARWWVSSQKPASGEKLPCYFYGENLPGRTHNFIKLLDKIYAISEDKNFYFLENHVMEGEDKRSLERKKILDSEWEQAKKMLDDKEPGTKLPCKNKYYQKYKIVDHYDDEAVVSRDVVLKHTFYYIDNQLYALTGNGHNDQGTYNKIKIALQIDANELFVLRISRKVSKCCSVPSHEKLAREENLLKIIEMNLAQANKPTCPKQKIIIMPYYMMDLFKAMSRENFLYRFCKMAIQQTKENNFFHFYHLVMLQAEIYLSVLNQIMLFFVKHRFIHRDVKPENILLSAEMTEGGIPVLRAVKLIDPDFAIEIKPQLDSEEPNPHYPYGTFDKPAGTPRYLPEEIFIKFHNPDKHFLDGRLNREQKNEKYISADRKKYRYALDTDLYALGVTISFMQKMGELKSVSPGSVGSNAAIPFFYVNLTSALIKIMCAKESDNRAAPNYIRIILILIIWSTQDLNKADNENNKNNFDRFISIDKNAELSALAEKNGFDYLKRPFSYFWISVFILGFSKMAGKNDVSIPDDLLSQFITIERALSNENAALHKEAVDFVTTFNTESFIQYSSEKQYSVIFFELLEKPIYVELKKEMLSFYILEKLKVNSGDINPLHYTSAIVTRSPTFFVQAQQNTKTTASAIECYSQK